jgi:hypothetical protein
MCLSKLLLLFSAAPNLEFSVVSVVPQAASRKVRILGISYCPFFPERSRKLGIPLIV